MGETSSLKAPSLPSKPPESCLNGRAYAAACQTVASLHTMAVLQEHQTDLLKDLDKAFNKVQVYRPLGSGLSPNNQGSFVCSLCVECVCSLCVEFVCSLCAEFVCSLCVEFVCSPSWELRTASPRGRYGERCQRDPCLKHTYIKHHLLAGDSL